MVSPWRWIFFFFLPASGVSDSLEGSTWGQQDTSHQGSQLSLGYSSPSTTVSRTNMFSRCLSMSQHAAIPVTTVVPTSGFLTLQVIGFLILQGSNSSPCSFNQARPALCPASSCPQCKPHVVLN